MSRESVRLDLANCLLLAQEGALTDDDFDFILGCLLSEDDYLLKMAVVLVPLFSREHVLKLISRWGSFSVPLKSRLVIPLAVMMFYEPYVLMLEELCITEDEYYAGLLVQCLGRTEYFVFPLLLPYLGTSDLRVLSYLKRILGMIDAEPIKLYLQLVPQVPFPSVFRDVFGGDLIDDLRKRE